MPFEPGLRVAIINPDWGFLVGFGTILHETIDVYGFPAYEVKVDGCHTIDYPPDWLTPTTKPESEKRW